MEIGSKSHCRIKRKGPGNSGNDIYLHKVQFYKLPPTGTISLCEFEEFAIERLKVLKAVETAGQKYIKSCDDYGAYIRNQLQNSKFSKIFKSNDDNDEEQMFRRLDLISHFILRLAYCKSEELRQWFVQQESDLFRFRFQKTLTKGQKQDFLVQNNLHYEMISVDERTELQEKLAAVIHKAASVVPTVDFFKVHFTEVLDLVQKRAVYLNKGHAYVQYEDMISLLLNVFKQHLRQALAITCRALPHLEEDNRLLPMLSGLSKRYLGSDYNVKKNTAGQLTAEMIDMLSKSSFPLCMQQLHMSLRQNHHLRYGGRQQYGLFLKAVGLSLEEALKFWRSEFTRMMDADKFDKQYSYNIRHNYGKEGKRADYTPFSCIKIIMSNTPGPGDSHGCPFKHTDMDLLRQKLKNMSVNDSYLEQIMSEVKAGRYNLACTRYFEAAHKLPLDSQAQAFSHPNQFFDESQKLLNTDSKSAILGTPRSKRSNTQISTQRSQISSNTAPSSQLSEIDEMNDDFDVTDAELSVQAP